MLYTSCVWGLREAVSSHERGGGGSRTPSTESSSGGAASDRWGVKSAILWSTPDAKTYKEGRVEGAVRALAQRCMGGIKSKV